MILTGGDPLMLSPRRIAEVTRRLGAIAHVKVLRWHTRVPVVAPERVTAGRSIAALRATDEDHLRRACMPIMPRELTPQRAPPAPASSMPASRMVSQTVLLKGVNDDADTLAELMRAFVEARVKPYYLHHGDLAPGTSHFRTTHRPRARP